MNDSAVDRLRHHPDPYVRYHAIEALDYESGDEALRALVEALADPGFWEVPNDVGEPSDLYAVSTRACQVLLERMPDAFEVFHEAARRSPAIAGGGARIYWAAGERGHKELREIVRRDPSEQSYPALNQLISILRDDKGHANRENLKTVIEALLHDNVSVRFAAMNYLPYYYQEHPTKRPTDLVADGFIEELAAAISAGRVQMDTGMIFIDDARILQAWVNRVGEGVHTPSFYSLLRPHLGRLDDQQVQTMVEAPLHPQTIALLGELGARAQAAIPRLVEALDDPARADHAKVALLTIPGGYSEVSDGLADQFMNDEASRQAIVANHPDPEAFAAEVVPGLTERWRTTGDLLWLRGMKAVGPLMKSESKWVAAQLKKSGVDKHARSYAIDIVATWGEAARPHFPQLRTLLDQTETRGDVLDALTRLGPIAADVFLARLEQLDQQSHRWLIWQTNWWRESLTKALKSLRQTSKG